MDYSKKLEKEFSQDQIAEKIIEDGRADGLSDEEIYNLLVSFY